MDLPAQVYRFGPFESRPHSSGLYRRGLRLRIRPQPLRVLNLLLSQAGAVVSREMLRDQLWSSETFVDFEHGLNTAVNELRAVLGDSALHPRYIQTLPKLGYRFIAHVELCEFASEPIPVTFAPSGAQEFAQEEMEHTGSSSKETAEGGERRRWLAFAISFALIAVLGASSYFVWTRYKKWTHANAASQTMLAVLPFENLTGDASQEYFSDGLTEEMIAQLGHADPQHLGVIARTSVMHYKQTREPMNQIGHELGVEYLLEGSVRRDTDRVRITAQLIRARDQAHVWSHQYDRAPNSLLSLQAEIAQEISDAIQLTLGDPQRPGNALAAASPGPSSYEAFDLYLQGRYFWNRRTGDGFQRSVDCFERAIAKDPSYARAYAGLADSYALMASYYVAPQNELIPKARTAALKALDLDEGLAEAHASLALIAQNYDWDWQTADKEFRRAIALDPNYATGHHWYAEHLAFRGRFDESFHEMNRARQLDPLSLIIQTDDAVGLYFARQYDRAIAQFRAVGEVEPYFPRVHMVTLAYVQQGRFSEALADVETWPHQSDTDSFWIWCERTYIYGRAGQQEQARRNLEALRRYGQRHTLDPMLLVIPYIGVGNKDEAFALLKKSVAAHSPGLVTLKVEPAFDPLRSDPRFDDVLRRVGLAQ
jgi:TolB-like protein/DNA-binding winged helix-turn-helix (wHTH) protein